MACTCCVVYRTTTGRKGKMKGKWEEAAAALHTAAAGTQAVGAVPVQGGAADLAMASLQEDQTRPTVLELRLLQI